MEKVKIEEYDAPMFRELKNLGCKFDPKIESFLIPLNKKPNASEIFNFYEARSKTMTPFQKKLKSYLEKNLPLDIYVKKTDKGVFLVDENGLIVKKDLVELLSKKGMKIARTMNGVRYLLNTEGGFGKL